MIKPEKSLKIPIIFPKNSENLLNFINKMSIDFAISNTMYIDYCHARFVVKKLLHVILMNCAWSF